MDAVTGHVSKAISSCNFLLVLGTLQNVWSLSQGAKAIISSLLKSDRRSLRTQLPLPCCVTLASHAHARGGGEPQVLPRGVATEIGSENRAGSTLEPQGSSSFLALQLSRTPVRAAARQQDRRTPGLVRERGGAAPRWPRRGLPAAPTLSLPWPFTLQPARLSPGPGRCTGSLRAARCLFLRAPARGMPLSGALGTLQETPTSAPHAFPDLF